MNILRRRAIHVLGCLLVVLLGACGGGGGSDGANNTAPPPAGGLRSPIADLTGSWTVTDSGVSDCPDQTTFTNGPYEVTVTQTGNDLTVVTPTGTFPGTIDGDKLSWAGSWPDDGGTVTIGSMTLTVAAGGGKFSGSSTWTWSDGTAACSGTTQSINGARVPGTGPLPPVPTGLTASTQSSSVINLNWSPGVISTTTAALRTAPVGGGYQIERSMSPDSGFAQVAFVAFSTTTHADSGLSPNTVYYYRVRASDDNGDSAYSDIANAMTLSAPAGVPASPSGLAVNAVSSNSIDVSWDDNASDETGFKIERSTIATSGFVQIAAVGANVTSFTNTGLTGATTYHYRVRATNAAGDSSPSNTANATTPPTVTAPAAPTNLSAVAQSSTSVRLTWTDTASNETGFKIERSTGAIRFTQIGVVAADATTFTDSGLSASTTYQYRVRATKANVTPALDSAYSNTADATTPAVAPTLRIINDLADSVAGPNDWGRMNKIIRVRIGTTESAVLNNTSLEKLWPIDSAPTSQVSHLSFVINPKFNQTTSFRDFDVSQFSSGSYWVFIQTGWWELVSDPFSGFQQSWQKHMANVVGCDINQTVLKWATFSVSGHQSGVFSVRASEILPIGNFFGSSFCP